MKLFKLFSIFAVFKTVENRLGVLIHTLLECVKIIDKAYENNIVLARNVGI